MRKYMVCVVGAERFAIPLSKVREVSSLNKITSLPGLPSAFMGLVNLRGNIIGAIDLATKLGMKSQGEQAHGTNRVSYVIVEHAGRQIALRVSEIAEVITVRDEDVDHQIEKLDAGMKKGLAGVAKTEDASLIMLLDLARLVEGGERAAG
jgi:purine-binding chemotaxis protein CheW